MRRAAVSTLAMCALLGAALPALGSSHNVPSPNPGAKASAKPSPKATSTPKPKKKTSHGGGSKASSRVSVDPSSGTEGTTITISYPSPLPDYPLPHRALFHDPGVHGWVIVHGAGDYVTWDGKNRLTYAAPAGAAPPSSRRNSYTATIPYGICGIVITSSQASSTKVPGGFIQGTTSVTAIGQTTKTYGSTKKKPAKILLVSLAGEKGKAAPFGLTCDTYTLSVKAKAAPKRVAVPPAGSSTITATLSVKGPAQFYNGKRFPKGKKRPTIKTPLANIDVWWHSTCCTLAPNPPITRTGRDGKTTATISWGDSDTAVVQAVAPGIGDAGAVVVFYTPTPSPSPSPAAKAGAAAAAATASPAAVRAKPRPGGGFDISQIFLTSQNGSLAGSGSATRLEAYYEWSHFENRVDYVIAHTGLPVDEFWDEYDFEDFLDYVFYHYTPAQQEEIFTKVQAGISWLDAAFNDSGFKYSAQGVGLNLGIRIQPQRPVSIYGTLTFYPSNTSTYVLPMQDAHYQYSQTTYDIGVKYQLGSGGLYLKGGFFDQGLHGKNQGGNITNYGPYVGLGTRF